MRTMGSRERQMRCVVFIQQLLTRHPKPRFELALAVMNRFEVSRASAYRLVSDCCDVLGVTLPELKMSPEHRAKIAASMRAHNVLMRRRELSVRTEQREASIQ